jgi:hypothetical protein
VNRLQVRVLLDTGPTEDEVTHIRSLFDAVGMDAEAVGHSYGGPPLTSAFRIVINAPLMPFLDRFAGANVGLGGRARLAGLLAELAALRADERRWGRPHDLYLEHAFGDLSVALPPDLPPDAIGALLEVDLSGLERGAPPVTVTWHRGLRRWQARPQIAGRSVGRRLPWRRPDPAPVRGVRQLDAAEVGRLWRLADDPRGSVVTWQRATVVLWSALGWDIAAISRTALISEARVRAMIGNFDADGFTSLTPGYAGGQPVRPTADEERDAGAIAGTGPAAHGLDLAEWDVTTLAEYLVAEGVVEDVDPVWLHALLSRPYAAVRAST